MSVYSLVIGQDVQRLSLCVASSLRTLTELMPQGSVIERDLLAQAQVTFSLIPELPRANGGVSGSVEVTPANSLLAQK